MSIWKPYQPSDKMPWDWRRVVHLHRRAAFAVDWKTVQQDVSGEHKATIQRVLAGKNDESFESTSKIIGEAAVNSGDPTRLKAWWLYRMMFSPHPLQEKMTLVWHNHFATSNLKLRNLSLMKSQNDVLRAHGLGSFRELLPAVVKHPAMLKWLDAGANRRGRPNENLGRELMELFTLGVGHYTEDDVKNAAKALTGWTTFKGAFRWKEERHETGAKTILGATKPFKGDDLIELLLNHKATSQRIAWRLCSCFMGEGVVDDNAIDELASGLRENDLNIAWGVETILSSELFFGDSNICSRVSSPAEFIVNAVRSLAILEKPPSTVVLADWCNRLGQELFYPPNVGGWNGGRSWLSTRTIIARSNFAVALSEGQLRAPSAAPTFKRLVIDAAGANDLESAAVFFGKLLCGTVLSESDRSKAIDQAREKAQERQVNHLVASILSQPAALVT